MLALNFDGGPVMDAVMWFASGIPNWIPLYLARKKLPRRRPMQGRKACRISSPTADSE